MEVHEEGELYTTRGFCRGRACHTKVLFSILSINIVLDATQRANRKPFPESGELRRQTESDAEICHLRTDGERATYRCRPSARRQMLLTVLKISETSRDQS